MVRKNNSFEEIWDKLKTARKVVMTLHSAPDGDSLGSCAAMKYVLERDFGIEVELVSGDELSNDFKNLSMSKDVREGVDIKEIALENFEVMLCLDTATPEMLGSYKKDYVLPKGVYVINIDHHETNKYYGSLNYVDSSQPSVCSILVDLLRDRKVSFDSKLSKRLLLGVCTDSGFFTYDSSPEKALSDATFLIANGADYLNDALRPVFYQQSLSMKRYVGLLIHNLKFNEEKKFGYSTVSFNDIQKLGLNKADIRLGINELQFIKEFDFVFNIVDNGEYLKGSFRSKRGVDVSKFAEELGGGGHEFAAAFMLDRSIGLEEAEKKVLSAIEKVGVYRVEDAKANT